ncbi:hypothetical protein [Castellaniella sp.]|jgi:hypothetical protein|uniref:hypothetical protein n=1 Tax=Castellaniella sp. TaxID=1955812 RepID=UPI002AFE62A6|nr:hypothetical protein [Castellaniella sp.]
MRTAFPRPAARFPVCRQACLRLAAFPVGRAETAEKAEGKIEETGTLSGRFPKLLLSAHWLGGRFRHYGFDRRSAAISRNALALLEFERHHGRRLHDFRRFRLEARP